MLKLKTIIACMTIAMFSPAVMAEQAEHFAGKPADNLEQAVKNFNQFNQRLQKAIAAEDMQAIHELTYTLENALARMATDLEQMAVNLEEVHLGSEAADSDRVNKYGARYLEAVKTLNKLGQ